MKTIFSKLRFFVSFVLPLAGCTDNMGETDSRLSDSKGLIEPVDGKAIVLETSTTASTYFEWEYADVEESGTALYQIAFDKMEGDFSNPVYKMYSDNNGYKNCATITHKVLNDIAAKAGIKSAETGTIKWTVFSSKGMNTVKSSVENSLTITRLAGFDVMPIDLFVTGEGSEGGTDLSKAHKMKAIANGEFEVYTKLAAGKAFQVVDATSGTPKEYSTADGLIKEGGTGVVSTDGVYKINLDFNTGACTYSLVTSLGFYFCPTDEILFEMPYVGYGVFQAKGTVTFKEESWGLDQRYKFRMNMKDNAGAGEEKTYEWGTVDASIDSAPTASSPESYYYVQLLSNLTQWDNKWKLMDQFNGIEATYTLYLTADGEYTHTVTK